MSRDFMNVCAHERARLNSKIAASEGVLDLYRQLWRVYAEMETVAEPTARAGWKAARSFIQETVSPILKSEIVLYRESLENVTRAQEKGCLEIAAGGTNG